MLRKRFQENILIIIHPKRSLFSNFQTKNKSRINRPTRNIILSQNSASESSSFRAGFHRDPLLIRRSNSTRSKFAYTFPRANSLSVPAPRANNIKHPKTLANDRVARANRQRNAWRYPRDVICNNNVGK